MDSRLTVYSLCLCVCRFGAYGGVVVHVCLCLCIQGKLVPWYSGKESACQCRRCVIRRIQSLGWEDPLKEEMATHSSIPAWTEESGWLQCMGSQRVSPAKHTCILYMKHNFKLITLQHKK